MKPLPSNAVAVAVGLCAVANKIALSLPDVQGKESLVAITWLVVASYVAVGIALLSSGLPRSNGWACMLVAVATVPGDLNSAWFATSYLTPVGYVLEPLYLPATTALVLCYPRGKLGIGERRLVLLLVAVSVGTRVLSASTTGDLPDGFRPPPQWPDVPAPLLHDVVSIQIGRFLVLTLLLVAGFLIASRPIKASGLARRSLAPLAVIGSLCALAAALDQAMWAFNLTSLSWTVPSLARNLTAAAIPVALLADLLRRRAAAAAISEKVLSAASCGNGHALEAALRDVLADPTLTVAVHDKTGWRAADGTAVSPVAGPRQRIEIVRKEDGTPLAAITVRATGEQDEGLMRTALMAVRVGAENNQMQAELLARMAELQESRTRIVEAGLTERRRVERDLHDGAQQRFLAVAATLARTDLVDDAHIRDVVGDARVGLSAAMRELRELARGIHPPILSQGGLPAALASLMTNGFDDVELRIDRELAVDRPNSAHESALYFVIAEALANAARHARATRITVEVHRSGPNVCATISDDGVGKVRLVNGGGLSGLRDRIEALGGTFSVHSDPCHKHPQHAGTTLIAVVSHTAGEP